MACDDEKGAYGLAPMCYRPTSGNREVGGDYWVVDMDNNRIEFQN